jgi:hypothetical protein
MYICSWNIKYYLLKNRSIGGYIEKKKISQWSSSPARHDPIKDSSNKHERQLGMHAVAKRFREATRLLVSRNGLANLSLFIANIYGFISNLEREVPKLSVRRPLAIGNAIHRMCVLALVNTWFFSVSDYGADAPPPPSLSLEPASPIAPPPFPRPRWIRRRR